MPNSRKSSFREQPGARVVYASSSPWCRESTKTISASARSSRGESARICASSSPAANCSVRKASTSSASPSAGSTCRAFATAITTTPASDRARGSPASPSTARRPSVPAVPSPATTSSRSRSAWTNSRTFSAKSCNCRASSPRASTALLRSRIATVAFARPAPSRCATSSAPSVARCGV